ncbi:tetratricopeptide repeat protein [Candidatus Uabimicrobium sp. HlEnr_7]|uniref:tetratricopeptide repeat protein n=1 Tax=Candidatus Uabimicrobium helgolandensis TaxID=3095367 RepID=UPI003557138F
MCPHFSDEYPKDKALEYYDKALSIDPQHSWSLLYRAHCLHDLQNWEEAAKAYSRLKANFFCGNQSWRYEIFLEQKGYCYYKAGEKSKALSEFSHLIERWKKDTYLCREAYGMYLAQIAENVPNFLTKDMIQFIEQQGWIKLYKTSNLVK